MSPKQRTFNSSLNLLLLNLFKISLKIINFLKDQENFQGEQTKSCGLKFYEQWVKLLKNKLSVKVFDLSIKRVGWRITGGKKYGHKLL